MLKHNLLDEPTISNEMRYFVLPDDGARSSLIGVFHHIINNMRSINKQQGVCKVIRLYLLGPLFGF